LACSRFCGGKSIQKQQTSPAFNTLRATGSIKTDCELQISIDFNKMRNRVRDQGAAGSNPGPRPISFQISDLQTIKIKMNPWEKTRGSDSAALVINSWIAAHPRTRE
jgi:hypothetical protein